MKRTIYTTLLIAAACFGAQAQEGNLTRVQVNQESVQKTGRTMQLDLLLDFSQLKVSRQRSVRLTPAIVQQEGNQEVVLQPIVIDGRIRSRIHQRQQALTGRSEATEGAYTVLKSGETLPDTLRYRATVTYEPWMTQSRLVIREQVTGCRECEEGREEMTVRQPFYTPYVPHYATTYLTPEKEEVKVRNEIRVARLQFRWDSYRVEAKYKGNQQELNTVSESIELVKDNPDLTIKGIYITGYASPEGKASYNQRLSIQRAEALARYAQKDTKTQASLWHVVGGGEDWEGFRREMTQHPDLLDPEQALKIYDSCKDDPDECERRIRFLIPAGEKRQRLMDEVYGPLRRNEYRIEYEVRGFNLEEAREQIKTRPDLLSVEEIYTVAQSYEKGSAEYHETMLTAARTYPANPAAIVNAAHLLIEEGQTGEAIQLMEASEAAQAPQVLNALGVAYAHEKQYARAQELFQQAEQAGSQDAKTNLREIQEVINDL